MEESDLQSGPLFFFLELLGVHLEREKRVNQKTKHTILSSKICRSKGKLLRES